MNTALWRANEAHVGGTQTQSNIIGHSNLLMVSLFSALGHLDAKREKKKRTSPSYFPSLHLKCISD